jgi:hypothetical protein
MFLFGAAWWLLTHVVGFGFWLLKGAGSLHVWQALFLAAAGYAAYKHWDLGKKLQAEAVLAFGLLKRDEAAFQKALIEAKVEAQKDVALFVEAVNKKYAELKAEAEKLMGKQTPPTPPAA